MNQGAVQMNYHLNETKKKKKQLDKIAIRPEIPDNWRSVKYRSKE